MLRNFLIISGIFFSLYASWDGQYARIAEVDFNVSMEKGSGEYNKKYADNSFNQSLLRQLEQLYQKNHISKIQATSDLKIPRIIHQIWVGPNKIPNLYQTLAESWKKYHPDWTYILWTDKDVEGMELVNQASYDKATSYSEKANILRYELLYRYGGVYVDIDFECLQSLDILHHYYDFYTGITPNNAGAVLANGIIGSKPSHHFIKKLIDDMKFYVHENTQLSRNGVRFFSAIFYQYFGLEHDECDIAFPATFFYPFKKHYGTKITATDYIRPESFGIHYWGNVLEQKINLYNQRR